MAKNAIDGKSIRKEVSDLEGMTQKLKRQFESHLFCLDTKASNKVEILGEWHEFVRKRSEIELEYSKTLERMADRFLERFNRMKQPAKGKNAEPTCPSSTSLDLLHSVLSETKGMAQRRTSYVEQFTMDVMTRIDTLNRDTTLISRKVRDVSTTMHDEMIKAYRELLEACKAYHQMAVATNESQHKLQKLKAPKKKGSEKEKSEKDRKKEMKALEQLMMNKQRMIRARNDYLLSMRGANVLTKRYFAKSLLDLFEYADYDFQWSMKKIYNAQAEVEHGLATLQQGVVDACVLKSESLDTRVDLDRFMADFGNFFMPPPEFQFIAYGQKERSELTVIEGLHTDLMEQRADLFSRITTTTSSIEEEYKTIECAKKELRVHQLGAFGPDDPKEAPSPSHDTRREGRSSSTRQSSQNIKQMQDIRKEHMDLLFNVFQRICRHGADIDRWTSQHDIMDDALRHLTIDDVHKLTQATIQETLEFNRMRKQEEVLPKLFQGNIDTYMAATGNAIPMIITSCIKFISTKGATTEGVFRVPGPAQEIEDLRLSFEKGIDPLVEGVTTQYDLHAVASLLKQYFRDLSEPIFPCSLYPTLMRIQQSNYDPVSKKDAVTSGIISRLSLNCVSVLRILFRFLHGYAEHSSKTKMNLSNLALVFGPTLMRAPASTDPIALAQEMQTVNSLCLFMLDNHSDLFGLSMSEEEAQGDNTTRTPTPTEQPSPEVHVPVEEPSIPEPPPIAIPEVEDQVQDEQELQEYAQVAYNRISGVHIIDDDQSGGESSETDTDEDQKFVKALHNYNARNDKELSFRKGELIEVYNLTEDGNWWDSNIGNRRGYIPASYVQEVLADLEKQTSDRHGSGASALERHGSGSGSTLERQSSTSAMLDRQAPVASTFSLSASAPVSALMSELPSSVMSAPGPLEQVPESDVLAQPDNRPVEHGEAQPRSVLQVLSQDDDRRHSTGETQTPRTTPLTSPVGVQAGPGSTQSLTRVESKIGIFSGPAAVPPKPVRPPVKSKPAKMPPSNFHSQLAGVVGRGGKPPVRLPTHQPQ